ncbi:hypothetical protein K504DRAFT_508526 [Pleomassaria siparia CBS 279.74]|uniref:RING-type domain-containing protein n=1 Tax=Pleomassaria siparia CBS 279.74 TaxID=1314801 RepID=A0A6G1JRM7_9PLEO|nr:hypothetical protein K504DRAFT_508526 [Pleomassaria siparia CBS 279.74]
MAIASSSPDDYYFQPTPVPPVIQPNMSPQNRSSDSYDESGASAPPSQEVLLMADGRPRCRWRLFQHHESLQYQCKRAALLTKSGTKSQEGHILELCREHGEVVLSSINRCFSPRTHSSDDDELSNSDNEVSDNDNDDEFDGTVVLKPSEFSRLVGLDQCAICIEQKSHIRQLDNCGHKMCVHCLARILESGLAMANRCDVDYPLAAFTESNLAPCIEYDRGRSGYIWHVPERVTVGFCIPSFSSTFGDGD